MSEAAQEPAPVEAASAGAMLRAAREAAGLHVAALAVSLKVPVRKLEALEDDRHDLLPDAVFVRALASSVCRTLKIDPQPVLERLPQTAKPRLVQDNDGINTPFRVPGDGPKPGGLRQLSRPVVLSVSVLLLGALAVVFLPATLWEEKAAGARSDPVMPPGTPVTVTSPPADTRSPDLVVTPLSAPAPAPAPVSPPVPSPATRAVAVPPPAPVASATMAAAATNAVAPRATPVAAPAPAVVTPPAAAARAASTPIAAVAAVPARAASASPAATAASAAAAQATTAGATPAGIVVFRTRGASWILVTDARGNEVLRRLMGTGDSAGATGALPLTVTIGSAEATEVQVRGKPFNLAPVSRDNVARFEVK